MPRVAPAEPVFRWGDWEQQLLKSPTKALIFNSDDFGDMTPRRFREQARKKFRHMGVTASIRGEEVLVALNA